MERPNNAPIGYLAIYRCDRCSACYLIPPIIFRQYRCPRCQQFMELVSVVVSNHSSEVSAFTYANITLLNIIFRSVDRMIVSKWLDIRLQQLNSHYSATQCIFGILIHCEKRNARGLVYNNKM